MSGGTSLEQVLWVGGISGVISLTLTPAVRRMALAIGCVSKPARDRWGQRAIGRLGGLAIAAGFLGTTTWLIRQDARMVGLFCATFLILGIGFLDDFRRLHPYTKLVLQIITSCIVVLAGVQFQIPAVPWLGIPLTIGWLVLIMNAFNLMDNMDGLAGGIGVIAAFFCGWHALQEGSQLTAILSAGLAGATLGFLRYNLPPAKIFMGDSGSQVLGLVLGTLTLMETWTQPTQLLGILAFPSLLLAVPIFDTCFVTIQRITHGRHPFQGGTDHLSHRLNILGLSTRQVVFTLYVISIAFGALGILLSAQSPLAVTGVWLLSVGIFMLIGAYLARVRVYTGAAAPPPAEIRVTFIDTMLVHKRRLLEVIADFVLIIACYVVAHALRFEGTLTPDLANLILKSLPWIIPIKMLAFYSCGLYRGFWRYTSLPDLVNIFQAVSLGSVFSALIVLYLWRFTGYSRAVFIIDGLLLFVTISGARITERLFNEWITSSIRDAIPVLIIGAGDTGELLLRQLKQSAQEKHRVVGFLDDDITKHGNDIHGIRILGSRENLGKIVQERQVREILIAMKHPPEELVRQIQAYCQENGICWRIITSIGSMESETAPQK